MQLVMRCSLLAGTTWLADSGLRFLQSPDGDVIDCVPAHLQPAFEHPKLRSQKPEEEPEERPRSSAGRFSDADLDEDDDPLPQVWRRSGEHCPEGTVPVRRTTEDDVLRATASSATRFGMKARGAGLGFARRDSTGGGHEVSANRRSLSHRRGDDGRRSTVNTPIIYLWLCKRSARNLLINGTPHTMKSGNDTNNCVIIVVCLRLASPIHPAQVTVTVQGAALAMASTCTCCRLDCIVKQWENVSTSLSS
uniref:Neprosin activation peptide domain-containing protein n=1 Tax=Zea mays TaxID=4577 RepID=C0P9X3_MAIZE|nr:unknown [Zea mays]